ncbi:hypothetical protein [Streptomyces sp. NPDC057740]|uniref:hypothetical protein n=1 Tax=Streptomyces sp. NPDC057740 TaxID=3346234 RepID=UPI0036974C5A
MNVLTARAFVAAVGTVAVLAGSSTQVSAAEPISANALSSPTTYAHYLKHSDKEGALDTLKGFQSLTPNEQSRFLDYLKDPSLFKDFLASSPKDQNSITGLSESRNQSVSLRHGDVTYESESAVSGLKAAARGLLAKGNHTVKRSNKIKVLGVTVIELKIWVSFHSNGHDITKVNDADGGQKNFSVAASFSKEKVKKSLGSEQFCERGGSCVGGHIAVASIIWNGSATVSGGAIQFDKKQTLTANAYGSGHSSLVNV